MAMNTDMGNRIRQLRKSSGLTLEKFGERIGIKKSSLSHIESGRTNPSDQTVRSICREFNVSETWLRTGSGGMSAARSRDEELTEAVDRLLSGEPAEFRRRLVLLLSRLDADQWEKLQQYALELVGENLTMMAEDEKESDLRYVAVEAFKRKSGQGGRPDAYTHTSASASVGGVA